MFLATQTSISNVLSTGPAVTVSAHIPDLHYFSGKGEKDVFPLWRDREGIDANVNIALLRELGDSITAVDVFAYVVGLLGTSAYTTRFFDELEESAPRVPVTKDTALFLEVARFGREIIAVQTYGERLPDAAPQGYVGTAIVEVSPADGEYPATVTYDADTSTLHIGDGVIGNVTPEVWNFEVSGVRVVSSWVGYRLAVKKGLKGPLDAIRPSRWSFDDELVELLWAVEYIVGAAAKGTALLNQVLGSEIFTRADMPVTTAAESKAPLARATLFDPRVEEL